MSQKVIDWSVPQRQAPSAMFIIIVNELFRLLKFLWPFILLSIIRSKSGLDKWDYIVFGISIITIVSSVLEFLFFRFSIVNRELIIRKGWLTKQTMVLPLEKIQAVHIEETWLHAAFQSAKVSFDSSGSETVEVKIHAIDKEKAESLREFIIGSRSQVTEQSKTEFDGTELIISLSAKDIFKLGISANHLEAFLLLLAFGFSVLDNMEKLVGDLQTGFWSWLVDFTESSTAGLLFSLAIAVLIVSIVFSFIRIALQYYDFSLSRSLKGFRIRTGLLNVKQKLVPYNKVQYISWSANWVRRKIGLHLLHFHSAGSGLVREKQEVKVPVTQKSFIPGILESYYPLLPVNDLQATRIHNAYVFRRVLLFAVIPAMIIVASTFWTWEANSFWVFLIIPYSAVNNYLFRKKFRLWVDAEALQIKKGIYGEEEIVMKWQKVQAVELQQSIYQRAHELATLKLVTAGGTVAIPFIPLNTAVNIQNYALYKIESSNENWM